MIHKVLVIVLSVSNNMVLLLQAVLIEAIREKQQCPEHIFLCVLPKNPANQKKKPLNVSFEIYHLVSKLVLNVWIMSTLIILCNVFFYESIINQLFVFILFQ